MERYDLLYRLYDEFDTETLREYQDFVDLFPPVDSRVALDYWREAGDELDRRKAEIRDAFAAGGTFAEIAARADRERAFTALDLRSKYGRGANALVLDVDETLRSAGRTDNEIPRGTLHLLTEFHERGVPIVICTGQTLENVKGFATQGLGGELVESGDVSVVYESGTGVFTPGHGERTKRLLYDDLDDEIRDAFDEIRARALPTAPTDLRRRLHLQGNEFNVTLKPNFEIGSRRAVEVIDAALLHLLDLLGEAVADATDADADDAGADAADPDGAGAADASASHERDSDRGGAWARAYYAAADPEIRGVIEASDRVDASEVDPEAIPAAVRERFDRIDVAYYRGDAAEIGSRELHKAVGVEAALDVLGVDDPFVLVMGDSKSDLRVMRWAAERDRGIAAAPEHASEDVLDHVLRTDGLVFDRGRADGVLRTAYALDLLARLD